MASRYMLRKTRLTAVPADPGDVVALRYLRVSSKKQDRGFSPEAQIKEVDAYIRRQGWEPGGTFRDTMRGSRDDRPDYLRLLDTARSLSKDGRPIAVVAVALD